MTDEEKVEKFNYFEKLHFKVTLGILGVSIIIIAIIGGIISQAAAIPKLLIDFTTAILYLAIASFLLAIVRVIKYLFKIRKLPNNIGIIRSISALIINPTSIIILFILVILMSLSGCTII